MSTIERHPRIPHRHIHIVGASGSGTTTLGAALAARLEYEHLDTDSFYWKQTDPPFQEARPVEMRRKLLRSVIDAVPAWVLSGSLSGWGDVFIPEFDLVIFLSLPHDVRMKRLEHRELGRYGADAISAGGAMHESYTAFLAWASRYDSAGFEQRSRALHEAWLGEMPVPVIRIDGELTTDRQIEILFDQLDASDTSSS